MEKLMIEIGVVMVVFIIGYRCGFKACYDYLMEELRNHDKKQ